VSAPVREGFVSGRSNKVGCAFGKVILFTKFLCFSSNIREVLRGFFNVFVYEF
jgi:hypothetical protein